MPIDRTYHCFIKADYELDQFGTENSSFIMMAATQHSPNTEMENVHKDEPMHEEQETRQTYMNRTDSKLAMANALTSLISTFRDEAQQQDEVLSALQNDATSNPDFGKLSLAEQWSTNEVCYWLTNIGLQDYIQSFYASSIDGAILLHDITQDLLKNDLNVKSIHISKILREIDSLKVHKVINL